jgi:hypothetical protein
MAHFVRTTGQARLRYGHGLRKARSWVNWSGLATLLGDLGEAVAAILGRLLAPLLIDPTIGP